MKHCLVSTLKPFLPAGHVDWQQETALFSWSLIPDIEVLIVGSIDQRGEELVSRYGFRWAPQVRTAFDAGYFTQSPLLNDLMRQALAESSAEWISLINADITVLPEYPEQLDQVLSRIDYSLHPRPFITVRRRDYQLNKPLSTEAEIRALGREHSRLHKKTGSDIFIMQRSFWQESLALMPPFIYGRFSWDVWFHRHALLEASIAVDASGAIPCFHPYHGSILDPSNPEVYYNLMLYDCLFGEGIFPLEDPRWLRI